MKGDRLYLLHILDCLARIQEYTQRGEADFFEDRMRQDAVVRNLQTMAESTQRLSAALKSAYAEVDWQGIADFRNVLVHDYLGLNLMLIWKIIRDQVPELKRAISRILEHTPA